MWKLKPQLPLETKKDSREITTFQTKCLRDFIIFYENEQVNMSVEQPNTVDFVSIDNEDNVVLTISDHLEWDSEKKHIYILQEKINTYITCVKTGQLNQKYPESINRKIVVLIFFLHHPNGDALVFLEHVRSVLAGMSISLKFQQKHFNSVW